MKHVFRVKLEQWTTWTADGKMHEDKYHEDTLDVIATSAPVALKKALTAARGNGFLRSKPVEVLSLERIASIDVP